VIAHNSIGVSFPPTNGLTCWQTPVAINVDLELYCTGSLSDSITVDWFDGALSSTGNIASYMLEYTPVSTGGSGFTLPTQTVSVTPANQYLAFQDKEWTFTNLGASNYNIVLKAIGVDGTILDQTTQVCSTCVAPATPMNLDEDVSFRGVDQLRVTWDAPFGTNAVDVNYKVTVEY